MQNIFRFGLVLFFTVSTYSQSKKQVIENLNKSYDSLVKIEQNLKTELSNVKLDLNNAELTLKILKEEKEKENESLKNENKTLHNTIKDKEILLYQKNIELLQSLNNSNTSNNSTLNAGTKIANYKIDAIDLNTLDFETTKSVEDIETIVEALNKNTNITYFKHQQKNFYVFQKTINNNLMVNGTIESDCENCYKLIVNYYTQDKKLFYQYLSEGCSVDGLKYLDLKLNLTKEEFNDVLLIETNSLNDLNKTKISDLKKMNDNIFSNFDLNYSKLIEVPEVFECTDFLHLIGK